MPQTSFYGLSVRAGLVLCLCLLSSLVHAIAKPAFDPRDYRHLVLNNRLEIMLVSDSQTPQGAFALEVGVGSLADPKPLGGLAHLVEHAILLGDSSKPDGSFRKFISAHRGKQGGQTSYEFTRYQASLDSDALAEALQRFGQLLEKPRFSAEALAGEIKILDEEFSLVRKKTVWRYRQPLTAVTAPDHPFRQFAPGNRESLGWVSQEQLHGAAVDFIQRHYTPDRMRLVVIGPQPLDELEQMSRQAFSHLPKRTTMLSPANPVLLDTSRLPARIDIQTRGEAATLNLLIPLPADPAIAHYKPVEYLQYVLDHQAPGSLQQQLRARGFIYQLIVGSGLGLGGQQTVSVTAALTPQGVEQIDQLIAELFAAFAAVREQALDPQLYAAFGNLLKVQEYISDQDSPRDLALHLLKQWRHYPAAEIRRGEYQLAPYQAERLARFFEALSPDNTLVILAHDQAEADQFSEPYRIGYGLHRITPEQLSLWHQAGPMERLNLSPQIQFLPQELKVWQIDNEPRPTLVHQGDGVQLWKALNQMGNTPRTRLYVALEAPSFGASTEQRAQGELWLKAAQRRLKPIQDQAARSGQSLSLYSHPQGLTLRVDGFRDQAIPLTRQALNALLEPLSEKEFDLAKRLTQKRLAAPSHKYAFEPLVDDLGSLLDESRPAPRQLLESLDPITFAGFNQYQSQFRGEMQWLAFQFGQAQTAEHQETQQLLTQALAKHRAPSYAKASLAPSTIRTPAPGQPAMLQNGERRLYQTPLKGQENALVLYHQAQQSQDDAQVLRTETILRMLTPLLKSSYFEEIRNRRQLAYGVLVVPFRFADTPGLSFIVQSRQTDPAQLTEVTEQFLQDFAQRLHDLPAKTFQNLQASLINELTAEITAADDLASYFWREISSDEPSFSKRGELIRTIRALQKSDLVEYAATHLAGPQQRTLVLQGWSGTLPETVVAKSEPAPQPKTQPAPAEAAASPTQPTPGAVQKVTL